MNILAISDPHDQFGHFYPESMPEADLCLVAGDFTNWGMRKPEEVGRASKWIRKMAERYPQIGYVLGNHDIGVPRAAFETGSGPYGFARITELGDAAEEICGVRLVGCSLSSCFAAPELKAQWAHMTDDPAIDAAAFEALATADIVVSHSPPVGWLDTTTSRVYDNAGYVLAGPSKGFAHIGSPGLLAYIERHKPRLVICGHVHEAAGEAEFEHEDGSVTAIYNVARTWRLIELGKGR